MTHNDDRPARDVRRARFAKWVRRQLMHAQQTRGWSIPKIAARAGIGHNTIYRWRDGEWVKGPLPDQVVAFCDALDVSPTHAFAILWPGQSDKPIPEPEPPLDADMKIVMRRLADPSVPEEEKVAIRAQLRYIADLAESTAKQRRRAS